MCSLCSVCSLTLAVCCSVLEGVSGRITATFLDCILAIDDFSANGALVTQTQSRSQCNTGALQLLVELDFFKQTLAGYLQPDTVRSHLQLHAHTRWHRSRC